MKIGILGCDDDILAVAIAAVEQGHTVGPAYDLSEDLPPSLSSIDRQPREQCSDLHPVESLVVDKCQPQQNAGPTFW